MGSPIAFRLVLARSPLAALPALPFGLFVRLAGGLFLLLPLARAQQPSPPAAAASPVPDTAATAAHREVEAGHDAAVFESISQEVAAIFAKTKDAVVRIQATDSYGPHSGTGFLIDPAGTIYTHYAVAGRSWDLTVEFAKKRYPAELLLADPRSGVALLRIQAAPTPYLPIGRSQDVQIASPVVTVGYPMDLPACPSFGLVAGLDQEFAGVLTTTHIHANIPVQSGEQGAPMLNSKGEVIGILVCRLDYGASCLALPIQAAEKVRADYLRFGEPRPGWIGVTVQPVSGDLNGAVEVAQLDDDTPAAHSGLKAGDILEQVGETKIHWFGDLRDASFYLTANEMVAIKVRRGDQEITVKALAVDLPGATPPMPQAPHDLFNSSAKVALPTAR